MLYRFWWVISRVNIFSIRCFRVDLRTNFERNYNSKNEHRRFIYKRRFENFDESTFSQRCRLHKKTSQYYDVSSTRLSNTTFFNEFDEFDMKNTKREKTSTNYNEQFFFDKKLYWSLFDSFFVFFKYMSKEFRAKYFKVCFDHFEFKLFDNN